LEVNGVEGPDHHVVHQDHLRGDLVEHVWLRGL
jgi:hypothetical protein